MSYDQNKQYTWDANQNFVQNGQEFGLNLNILKAIVSTPEAKIVLAAAQALSSFDKKIEQGIIEGTIKEVPTEAVREEFVEEVEAVEE